MAEEKIHNVEVVLRYAVTGSKSAAKKALFEEFRAGQQHSYEQIHSEGQSSRLVCADVNPGECEGYRNYETFTIGVWLKNDRKLYDQCRIEAKNTLLIVKDHGDRLEGLSPELAMADWLQSFVEKKLWVDQREEKASNYADRMFVSLAQAALDRVDWRELGEEWIQDAQEG